MMQQGFKNEKPYYEDLTSLPLVTKSEDRSDEEDNS
jgi:hypothetical protein